MRHATLRSEFLLQLLERLGSDKLGGDPKARLALEAAGMPFPQVRCAIYLRVHRHNIAYGFLLPCCC